MRARWLLVSCLVACLAPRAAVAEEAAPAPPAPPAGVEDQKVAAHAHFDRGLAASNDQRFGEAAAEFEKAYELAPDYRVLYNIGKVRSALGRFAEAADAFQGYLDRGGPDIPEERRKEVRDTLAADLAHVATVAVRVSPDGAEVRLDGKLVGVSPLPAPLRVTEGKHTVEALLPSRPVQLREIDVPGASALDVALDFPVAASLAAPPPAPPAPALVEKTPAPAPSRRWRTVGYTLAGAGLVATLAGSLLAYRAATDANDARARLVDAAMPAMGAPDVMKYDAAKLSFDDAKTRNQLGWALVGFGVAALAAGGTLALVWSGSSASVGGSW
jgi:tetratricopeptide (TPR) repeat protein